MFNIVWEFIINLLESFLFAVICNANLLNVNIIIIRLNKHYSYYVNHY